LSKLRKKDVYLVEWIGILGKVKGKESQKKKR
jgi:hypothetical protein